MHIVGFLMAPSLANVGRVTAPAMTGAIIAAKESHRFASDWMRLPASQVRPDCTLHCEGVCFKGQGVLHADLHAVHRTTTCCWTAYHLARAVGTRGSTAETTCRGKTSQWSHACSSLLELSRCTDGGGLPQFMVNSCSGACTAEVRIAATAIRDTTADCRQVSSSVTCQASVAWRCSPGTLVATAGGGRNGDCMQQKHANRALTGAWDGPSASNTHNKHCPALACWFGLLAVALAKAIVVAVALHI